VRQTDLMVTVGFLHTSPVHVPVFDGLVAAADPSATTLTVVDAELLDAARRLGTSDVGVFAGIEHAIRELADGGADRVVCTCSTIGDAAEVIGRRIGVDVTRVDRAMAERAVAVGERIVVLVTLESTIEPTIDLLRSVARASGVPPSLRAIMVEGAWACFAAGDLDGHHALVAAAIRRVGDEADVVVLAQASMAPAADLVDVGFPVLISPTLAVDGLLDAPSASSDP